MIGILVHLQSAVGRRTRLIGSKSRALVPKVGTNRNHQQLAALAAQALPTIQTKEKKKRLMAMLLAAWLKAQMPPSLEKQSRSRGRLLDLHHRMPATATMIRMELVTTNLKLDSVIDSLQACERS